MNNTDTFTSTDQNTGRTITWNIVGITENGPRTFIKSGYTHTVFPSAATVAGPTPSQSRSSTVRSSANYTWSRRRMTNESSR